MFKFDELCELIHLVGSTEVASVEIEHAGGRLRIDGKAPVSVVNHVAAPSSTVVSTAAPVTAETALGAVTEGAPGTGSTDAGGAAEEDLHYRHLSHRRHLLPVARTPTPIPTSRSATRSRAEGRSASSRR